MLVLDYEMARLPLPAWLWTDSWSRFARETKDGNGATDDLRSGGRGARTLYTPALISTSPSNSTTARNATLGVVLTCLRSGGGGGRRCLAPARLYPSPLRH